MRSRVAALVLVAFAAGCGSKEDRVVEEGLSKVATERSAHPHYPIIVFGDFGGDNQPAGMTVDAYGFYIHETTKAAPGITMLSSASASEKLERTFERSIQSIKAAEADTPPPKPPLPSNNDWKKALHPKDGTYTIVTQFGANPHQFDVAVGGSGKDLSGELPLLKPELNREAAEVIAGCLKAQNERLKASETPAGFSLCTAELLKIQQGSRGVEPHLMGSPLLLVPIDKGLALKGLDRSIRILMTSTAKIRPSPSTAHLVVEGPGFTETFDVSLADREAEERGIKAAVEGLGAKIDELNKT